MDDSRKRNNISVVANQHFVFSKRSKFFIVFGFSALLFFLIILLLYYYLLLTPAKKFPIETPITISAGYSVKETATVLYDNGFIKSKLSLYLSLILWHKLEDIKADTYIFSEPLSAKDLTVELTTGHFAKNLVKLTLIEGERAELIAKRTKEKLPDFDSVEFLRLAVPEEGKLFPDTYHVPSTFTATELFSLLSQTYKTKIEPLRKEIEASDYNESEVLTLASILEREANTPESMSIVAGILEKRLKMKMPLQVDATLEYILDKPLAKLSATDLDLDSPYNTYKIIGLPPTPIGNPGLDSIKAVLHPKETSYLFYITDNSGKFHYAQSFDEHKQNIAKYLR